MSAAQRHVRQKTLKTFDMSHFIYADLSVRIYEYHTFKLQIFRSITNLDQLFT
jgi:hypothetical protein